VDDRVYIEVAVRGQITLPTKHAVELFLAKCADVADGQQCAEHRITHSIIAAHIVARLLAVGLIAAWTRGTDKQASRHARHGIVVA
jgi:hypothetical protein